MAELLYNLFNSQAFWGIFVAWILIGVAWWSKLQDLLNRLASIIAKPIIFQNDPAEEELGGYPRSHLEDLAKGFRKFLSQPFHALAIGFSKKIQEMHEVVYDPKHKARIFGSLLFLGFTVLFLWSDAIAIAAGLDTLGFIEGAIPPWLRQYGVAVGVATFGSVIVGFLMLFQLFAEDADFARLGESRGGVREIAKVLSLVVIMIGVMVGVLIGINRMIALGFLEGTDPVIFWIQLGANVLIMVNGVLSAALVFTDALRGLIAVFIGLMWGIAGVVFVLDYASTAIGSSLPILLDLIWRAIYVFLSILLYFLFMPFRAILNAIAWPFRKLGSGNRGEDPKKRQ